MLEPSNLDGKMSMTMTATEHYWSGHVEAVKAQTITTKAYAQRHGLVLSTLYYWQRKLKPAATLRVATVAVTPPTVPGKFVSLHIRSETPQHTARPESTNCTLVLGAGVRLEMTAPPEPQWLVDLVRCADGVR